MAEVVDAAADTIRIFVSAFGCSLQFGITKPQLVEGQEAPATVERVATIRVTPEFVKGMAFLLREHVFQYEKTVGAKLPLPPDMMAQVLRGSTPERWNRCWRRKLVLW